tara:strand:+ start:678 stop:947 length:270 start_codon:yes stop_codon:yes gene_type:complete
MSVAERIREKLQAGLSPASLNVIDESHKHEGHAGHQPGGETHFHVDIVSDAFAGQNRVNRQRQVYKLLAEELADRVHALSLTTRTPDEA